VANEELQQWTSSGLMSDLFEIKEFDLVVFWNMSDIGQGFLSI